jgi:GNAT superfamily N-acetyltransferase
MHSNIDLKTARIEPVTTASSAKLLKFIKAYYRFEEIPFDSKSIASDLSRLLRDPILGRAWFIRANRRNVGYVIVTFGFDLEFGGRVATVTELYIEPVHRRKGIGSQVLGQIEEFCKTFGVRSMELQVTRKNAKVMKFYRRLGFDAHDRIPMSKRIA